MRPLFALVDAKRMMGIFVSSDSQDAFEHDKAIVLCWWLWRVFKLMLVIAAWIYFRNLMGVFE